MINRISRVPSPQEDPRRDKEYRIGKTPPNGPKAWTSTNSSARGWRPTPFREFILKIHSRCNLACDYCYMYEMADQGWRSQPRRMAKPTVDRVAERIAEHARAHGRDRVDVVLHGGEPLLVGPDHLRYVAESLRKTCDPDVQVVLRMQTNGVLIDRHYLDLFEEFGIRVGVSIDGACEDHDRHRTRANGRGSHAEVQAGIERLNTRDRRLLSGLLTTVDLESDPVATFEHLIGYDPPGIDFLLPHGHWDEPPPGLVAHRTPLRTLDGRGVRPLVRRTRTRDQRPHVQRDHPPDPWAAPPEPRASGSHRPLWWWWKPMGALNRSTASSPPSRGPPTPPCTPSPTPSRTPSTCPRSPPARSAPVP